MLKEFALVHLLISKKRFVCLLNNIENEIVFLLKLSIVTLFFRLRDFNI